MNGPVSKPERPEIKTSVLGFCAACNDYTEADLDTLRCLKCHQVIIFIPLRQPQGD
jgi:hypothetical protein